MKRNIKTVFSHKLLPIVPQNQRNFHSVAHPRLRLTAAWASDDIMRDERTVSDA